MGLLHCYQHELMKKCCCYPNIHRTGIKAVSFSVPGYRGEEILSPGMKIIPEFTTSF